jgi:hypothetical protein
VQSAARDYRRTPAATSLLLIEAKAPSTRTRQLPCSGMGSKESHHPGNTRRAGGGHQLSKLLFTLLALSTSQMMQSNCMPPPPSESVTQLKTCLFAVMLCAGLDVVLAGSRNITGLHVHHELCVLFLHVAATAYTHVSYCQCH